jgi:hypothetical protein
MKRGLNKDQIMAGLEVAQLESGMGTSALSRQHQNQSGTDVQGIFQQDPGYSGDHNDPHNAAGQFFDRFIARGGLKMSPGAGAVKVQVGTYGPGYVDSFAPQVQGYYDRLAPPTATPPGASPLPNPPPGYSSGGSVDTVPIMGQPGEHMLDVSDVNAMGGQANVYAFRKALHMSVGGEVPEGPQLGPHPPPPPSPKPPAPSPSPSASAGSSGSGLSFSSGQGTGPAPGPSPIGGAEPKNAPGGSQSGGGLVGAATGAAAMAADMFAPGSGAAVQIASQEAQRAIKFAGQATAIGLGGLMETFLPFGGSDLANNNWLTRGASAFAGVQPQIPNTAGKSASVDAMQKGPAAPGPMPLPRPISSGQGDGPAPGPTVVNNTFHVSNTGAANDTNEHVLAGLVGKQYDPVGAR